MFSVVYLSLSCLDRHVCLNFQFDKNRYCESVRDWIFNFFETLWKILSLFAKKFSFLTKFFSTNFKIRISIERRPSFLCACILPWSFFALWGDYLTAIFNFFLFLKNQLTNFEISVSMNRKNL